MCVFCFRTAGGQADTVIAYCDELSVRVPDAAASLPLPRALDARILNAGVVSLSRAFFKTF